MCLIAFAVRARPGLALLLAANRDEFFERPTAPLHRWTLPGGGEVLAGRDLREGGTWLGVGLNGRVAMLTNVRSAQPPAGQRSRGELVTRWLAGEPLDALRADLVPQAYGGFNLVVGELHSGAWHWLSNCDPHRPADGTQPRLTGHALPPGVYGLSNAALDTPWPKTLHLKAALTRALPAVRQTNPPPHWDNGLIQALANDTTAPAHQLPATGIDPKREAQLSSAFVRMPEQAYGTRSSLVMRIAAAPDHAGWQLDAQEWTHTPAEPDGVHQWDASRLRRESLRLLPS